MQNGQKQTGSKTETIGIWSAVVILVAFFIAAQLIKRGSIKNGFIW